MSDYYWRSRLVKINVSKTDISIDVATGTMLHLNLLQMLIMLHLDTVSKMINIADQKRKRKVKNIEFVMMKNYHLMTSHFM